MQSFIILGKYEYVLIWGEIVYFIYQCPSFTYETRLEDYESQLSGEFSIF